jgi:integrase
MATRRKKRIDGTGTITRRESGRYTAQATDPDTGRRRSLGTFETEKQAELALAKALAAGGSGVSADLSLGDYLSAWIERHASYVSEGTTERYRNDARRYVLFAPIATKPLGRLEADDFRTLYASLRRQGGVGGRPLGDRTVEGVDKMLRAAIHTAIDDGGLRANPLPRERFKVHAEERPWADTRQIARLLQVVRFVDADLEVAVRLGALYGFRRGEVAGLTWSDVGVDRVRINRGRVIVEGRAVTKRPKTTGSKATVLIDDDTAAVLRSMRERRAAFIGEHVPTHEAVYVRPTGEPLYPDTLSERFSRIVRAFNVTHADEPLAEGFTLHSLRHSFASNLIAGGVSTILVAAAGRWESTTLVERTYGHLAPSTVADVVAQQAAAVAGTEVG